MIILERDNLLRCIRPLVHGGLAQVSMGSRPRHNRKSCESRSNPRRYTAVCMPGSQRLPAHPDSGGEWWHKGDW